MIRQKALSEQFREAFRVVISCEGGSLRSALWHGVSAHDTGFRVAARHQDLRYNASMRRWLSIATLGFLLMALPLWGQGRGGGAAHSGSRGGFASHSSSFSSGFSSGAFHGVHGGSFARSSGGRIRTGNPYQGRPYHNRRGFSGRGRYYSYYPYAGYYPYGYYGWYDDPLAYDTGDQDQDSYASYQGPAYPASSADGGMQRDVQALSGKVDRLQADVDARNRPEPGPEPETALVFRDQHVEEVRNYAISGGAVWVLNAQAAKKIPLVNLDIDATVKMNEDRGVDFQVPEPALQIMIVR